MYRDLVTADDEPAAGRREPGRVTESPVRSEP
jgi:hypothetical protein